MKVNAVMLIVGIIMIAVSFTVFPTIITGANAIRTAVSASAYTYTGLSSVVLIGPTLIFLGLLFGGLASFGLGMKGLIGRA